MMAWAGLDGLFCRSETLCCDQEEEADEQAGCEASSDGVVSDAGGAFVHEIDVASEFNGYIVRPTSECGAAKVARAYAPFTGTWQMESVTGEDSFLSGCGYGFFFRTLKLALLQYSTVCYTLGVSEGAPTLTTRFTSVGVDVRRTDRVGIALLSPPSQAGADTVTLRGHSLTADGCAIELKVVRFSGRGGAACECTSTALWALADDDTGDLVVLSKKALFYAGPSSDFDVYLTTQRYSRVN